MKLDRLTRSVKDLGSLIEEKFCDRFALMSVSESINTESAAGRLVLNVLASVAQWEREAIAERTKDAMQNMKANGQYTGGQAPYGYRRRHDGLLSEVPSEQALIVMVRKLHEDGWRPFEIRDAANARGFKTRRGNALQVANITSILKTV
jgi:DNA invertase Pin-like site-specific DNA recombinase